MLDWRIMHGEIIRDFTLYINQVSDKFILKGGTSLMLCYGLTRFSEDIDLDGMNKKFFNIVDGFIARYSVKYPNITYRIGKDTDTVKRAFIHYGGQKPLKIEVSYRKGMIQTSEYTNINGILVYNIQDIMYMKLNAFNHRDKLRDLYDIVFIYLNYKQSLSLLMINMIKDSISHKGLEQFDYLISEQSDDLINNNDLAANFLTMYYDLGLQ